MLVARSSCSLDLRRVFAPGRAFARASGVGMPRQPIATSLYPQARRDLTIVDSFNGTEVADPYRYMENPEGAETKAWVDALNAIAEPYLNHAPSRDKMRRVLTEMWDFERYSCIGKHHGFYFYWHNTGLQNQSVLFKAKTPTEKGEVFLDPNTFSDDGTTSIRITDWSHDGKIYAYGVSEKGSDWTTIKFRTIDGKDLPDVVPNVKHSDLAFTHDNSGVFYCKYPEHKGASEGTSTEKHEYHSLYFHKLGTDAKNDVLVYSDRSDPNYMVGFHVSEDGHFLIIDVSRGCDPYNMLYYVDLLEHGEITKQIVPVPLFTKLDAKYSFIHNEDNDFYIKTNKDAPMFKLIKLNPKEPTKQEVLIPENDKRKLDWVAAFAGTRLMACSLEDVKSVLYIHDIKTGKELNKIPLEIGSVGSAYVRKDDDEVFFSFESHLTPAIVYRMDFKAVDTAVCPPIEAVKKVHFKQFETTDYETKQIFYKSTDGTPVPMYILSKKGVSLDGQNPVLLNGYGGFNIAETPGFSITRLFFLRYFNGIVALPNIRGGSEYGERWHEGGMLDKKQNVFDDFHTAAKYLIEHKYTNPSKLSIMGGSNGGLLVGACSQQNPLLYGAVINRVGVLDMLRFHKFTIGAAWVPEFGDPDKPEDFAFIYKYSPLHNIRFPPGEQWPSTLLLTADHDDRVVPSHTLKYMAELYYKAKQHPTQDNPLLARIEVKAGHGSGKPTAKVIEEYVDIFSFLERTLDLHWTA